VKIGVLGWDRGDEDPDSPGLAEAGRRLGHDTSLFLLDEVTYAAARVGLRVLLGGEPADSFDAVICRANLYGDWHHRPFTGWEERLERLQSVSAVLGPRMFDPAEVWFAGYSKFLTAQKLAAAGLPAPPTRSATSMADVPRRSPSWGPTVVKPSFGLRAMDVERVTDPPTRPRWSWSSGCWAATARCCARRTTRPSSASSGSRSPARRTRSTCSSCPRTGRGGSRRWRGPASSGWTPRRSWPTCACGRPGRWG
jgi:hypothetical protein